MADKERIYISFYPDEEAQGGALRQTLVLDVKRGNELHARVIRLARRKMEELKAKSFVIYKLDILLSEEAENG